jgi:hypothetical protein
MGQPCYLCHCEAFHLLLYSLLKSCGNLMSLNNKLSLRDFSLLALLLAEKSWQSQSPKPICGSVVKIYAKAPM